MDEASTIKMLDELIDISSRVEYVPDLDACFTIDLLANKPAIIKCVKYFGESAELSIDSRGYDIDELDNVNSGSCELFIRLPSPFSCFHDVEAIVDYIYRIASSRDGEIPITSERRYIFDGALCSLDDLSDKYQEIYNAILACRVYTRLLKLQDESASDSFFIQSDFLVKYHAGFEKGYAGRLDKAIDFISAVDRYSEEGDDILMLLKSEINNETRHVSSDERVKCFFDKLDVIMDNFIISKNGYLSKFTSRNLKKTYLESCRILHVRMKETMASLKSELVVFLTMYFTLSEFSSEDGFSAVNILIMFGLFIAALICTFLLKNDKNAIRIVKEEADNQVTELEAMPDAESTPIKELAVNFKRIVRMAKATSVLFIIAQAALFIPVIIAFFVCYNA